MTLGQKLIDPAPMDILAMHQISKRQICLGRSHGGEANILLLLFISKIELTLLPINCRRPGVDSNNLAPEMTFAIIKGDIASGRVGKLNNILMGSHRSAKKSAAVRSARCGTTQQSTRYGLLPPQAECTRSEGGRTLIGYVRVQFNKQQNEND